VLVRQRQEVQALPRRLSSTTDGAGSAARKLEAADSRVLQWEGCFNVRDLGGLPTSGGGRIRRGAVVRSDHLCRLTGSGRASLLEHGVRTIVDVRFPDEVASDWDSYPFRDSTTDPAVRYVNAPFNIGRDQASHDEIHAAYRTAASRGELNRLDLDWSAPGIASAVAAIADAPLGAVVVHCHGGKDRTGAVIALLLALLGVPDDAIADDYALSGVNLEPLISEWLDHMSDEPAERARLRILATPNREAMLEMLDHLRTRYGSAESYLRAGGLTDDQAARLRSRLLE
jgi:protein-tyrosine phosphatase